MAHQLGLHRQAHRMLRRRVPPETPETRAQVNKNWRAHGKTVLFKIYETFLLKFAIRSIPYCRERSKPFPKTIITIEQPAQAGPVLTWYQKRRCRLRIRSELAPTEWQSVNPPKLNISPVSKQD